MPTKKGRVAIVFPEQVYPGKLGNTRMLVDLANALLRKGYEVRVFSLGREGKLLRSGTYREEVLPSPVATDSRTSSTRVIDYLGLALLQRQRTYYIINYNMALYEAVERFDPAFVVGLGRMLTDFMLRYRDSHAGVRALTITDDFRVVENSLRIRTDKARSSNPARHAAVSFMSSRFRAFSWEVYSRMVEGLDAVVYLTQEDRELAARRFPALAAKFHVLPTATCPEREVLKRSAHRISPTVKTVLFIGNSRHEPNAQAMEIIERTIAPRLPDKRFIILGSGTEARSVGNVEYTGYVSDAEKRRIIDGADVCIAPLVNGSGIKVKMLDYFMRCRPIIATPLALEGYPVRDGVQVVVEEDPERYADQILRLERDVKMREKLSRSCPSVCAYFSYGNIGDKWGAMLSSLSRSSKQAKKQPKRLPS